MIGNSLQKQTWQQYIIHPKNQILHKKMKIDFHNIWPTTLQQIYTNKSLIAYKYSKISAKQKKCQE